MCVLVATIFPEIIIFQKFLSCIHNKGKKLAGPGARATLPSSEEIRNELGMEIYTIYKSLENQVAMSSFL